MVSNLSFPVHWSRECPTEYMSNLTVTLWSLIIGFVPIFTVFAYETFLLSMGATAMGNFLLASRPWWSRIPGFPPGNPGSIPGEGTKSSHQDCSLLSLQIIMTA